MSWWGCCTFTEILTPMNATVRLLIPGRCSRVYFQMAYNSRQCLYCSWKYILFRSRPYLIIEHIYLNSSTLLSSWQLIIIIVQCFFCINLHVRSGECFTRIMFCLTTVDFVEVTFLFSQEANPSVKHVKIYPGLFFFIYDIIKRNKNKMKKKKTNQ